jgi:hypothetical protein
LAEIRAHSVIDAVAKELSPLPRTIVAISGSSQFRPSKRLPQD